MKTDWSTKVLLALIAVALVWIAAKPYENPPSVEASRGLGFDCKGDLKAGAWGGVKEVVGGYRISLQCE